MKKNLLNLVKLVFAGFIIASISIGCDNKKEEVSPNNNTTDTTDTTKNDTTTTKNDSTITTNTDLKVNAITVNGEEITFTSVTYGSGQLRAQAATNNQDLDLLIIFFPNGNTGNGLTIPANGEYNVIESFSGVVIDNNTASVRFTYKSDVYNFLKSTTNNKKIVVGKSGDFHTFKLSDVTLNKYKHTFGNANSGPKGEKMALNTELQIKSTLTGTAGGTITENGQSYTATSVTKKATSLYTEVEFKATVTTPYTLVTLKLNFGKPTLTDGTYKVVSWMGVEPKSDEVQLSYNNISSVEGVLKNLLAFSNSTDGGTVTVSGNKVTFSNLKFSNNTTSTTITGDFSF